MKNVYYMLMAALIVGLFANCGKKDDNHDGAAEIPATCYLMQTSAVAPNPASGQCAYNYSAVGFSNAIGTNNSMYGSQYGSPYGQQQYAYTYGAQSTPSCPASNTGGQQMLVYSNTKGLGCVDTSRLFMSGQVVTYDLNRSTWNFSPVPTPTALYSNNPYAYNNYGGMNGYQTSGYQTLSPTMVLRVCDASETCASGQTCRSPFGPAPQIASPIGVCYYN